MFAIGFDLRVRETQLHHPKGVPSAYNEIGKTLSAFGLKRIQGSLYTTANEDLANLSAAMNALKALSWFPKCVRDIRAFRVEQWSDFTSFMTG